MRKKVIVQKVEKIYCTKNQKEFIVEKKVKNSLSYKKVKRNLLNKKFHEKFIV